MVVFFKLFIKDSRLEHVLEALKVPVGAQVIVIAGVRLLSDLLDVLLPISQLNLVPKLSVGNGLFISQSYFLLQRDFPFHVVFYFYDSFFSSGKLLRL